MTAAAETGNNEGEQKGERIPRVAKVLEKCPQVFSISTTLPPARNIDHEIPLMPEAKPFKLKPYRYPLKNQR